LSRLAPRLTACCGTATICGCGAKATRQVPRLR
jgi:hypothetical protein